MSMMLDATTQGALYQRLLDDDSRPVPDVYRWQAPMGDDQLRVPVSRYTSPEFHRSRSRRSGSACGRWRAARKTSPRSATTSTTRSPAFRCWSSGRPPTRSRPSATSAVTAGACSRSTRGATEELRCAFHGIAWNLDGSLKHIPCRWDFPQVRRRVVAARGEESARGAGSCSSTSIRTADRSRITSETCRSTSRLAARGPFQGGARRQDPALQLEARAGGVHGVVPRRGHSPATPGRHGRHHHAVRLVRQLRPRDHPERPSEHAPASGIPTEQEMLDAIVDRTLDVPSPLVVPEGGDGASGARRPPPCSDGRRARRRAGRTRCPTPR